MIKFGLGMRIEAYVEWSERSIVKGKLRSSPLLIFVSLVFTLTDFQSSRLRCNQMSRSALPDSAWYAGYFNPLGRHMHVSSLRLTLKPSSIGHEAGSMVDTPSASMQVWLKREHNEETCDLQRNYGALDLKYEGNGVSWGSSNRTWKGRKRKSNSTMFILLVVLSRTLCDHYVSICNH